MGVAVGIDLGTTNSAIARLDEYQKPVIIPNDMGEPITPSVICFKDGEVIVGREAKELQRAGEPDVAAFFKRQMGMPNFAFYAAGHEYTPVDLSAFVLRKLKRDAEAVLGEAVTDAVITVPAYFKNPQREATIAAGRKAGLHVLQIINEPTAAAKAYRFSGAGMNKTLLVYDLGGGTFDVTLLQLTKDALKILTSEGDYELGGKDWDDRIIEYLMGHFKDEFGFDPFDDAASVSDLLVRAEEAKKKLSASTTAMVTIRSGTSTGRYEITRLQLDQMTSDLMERTCSLCRKVLAQHHFSPEQIDGVLLVGGSTRMAMVRRFIEDMFGKPPMSGVNVDEAVALGAAIEAGEQIAEKKPDSQRTFRLAGRIRTVDVTNHSLGMIAINNKGDAYINSIILAKDRQIPCVESRPYQVRATRVAETEIYMTQGESKVISGKELPMLEEACSDEPPGI
jgi:molecular chaperone DnaK